MKKKAEQYDSQEARKRFDAALRGALSTPPKPLREVSPKRPKQRRKNKPKGD